jgi:hypothetical protein
MKAFALVLIAVSFAGGAAARTWVATNCSNSNGSVKWVSGDAHADKINLKYSNFVEGTLVLELEKVNIEFMSELVLRERTFRACPASGLARVFAGKVRITGSEKFPNVLRSQFPENRVQTEVICTTVETESRDCLPQ